LAFSILPKYPLSPKDDEDAALLFVAPADADDAEVVASTGSQSSPLLASVAMVDAYRRMSMSMAELLVEEAEESEDARLSNRILLP
jgi:hypothetical protein